MARRSDHSREEIKELALNATEEIVAEAGFQALSARKVASAIGYTVGTIYLVFKNLDDLIMQVNARTLETLFKEVSVHQSKNNQKEKKVYEAHEINLNRLVLNDMQGQYSKQESETL